MKRTVLLLAVAGVLAACASKPEDITATYVSPVIYENYSCEELSIEAQRISSRAASMAGVQEKKATNDAVAVGVGVVLFWPALFFIKGNGATEAEVANLKGHMDAIEQASIQKKCGFEFQRT
jgi:hypothetical protein